MEKKLQINLLTVSFIDLIRYFFFFSVKSIFTLSFLKIYYILIFRDKNFFFNIFK